MLLTKIDGELVVVNNQGWNTEARAGTFLQSLDDWDATYRQRFGHDISHQLIVTTETIPFSH